MLSSGMTLRPTGRPTLRPIPARVDLRRRVAFSLVELVIVVVIIGIVSSIAVPRFSRAAKAATANSLRSTLSNVRRSIDIYAAGHGSYPGYNPAGNPDGDWFVKQLIQYSSQDGRTNANFAAPYIFGPYLRGPFPANPFNDLRTVHAKADPSVADPADDTAGWITVLSTGDFYINSPDTKITELDVTGIEDGKFFKPGFSGG
ncbi:MAG: prepilin-type N-terminal cleavage/methylation domain-containing protein [bacterium]|nr:prepilin-type N-terminal cleavage/methylation domain-containing protein [bacterium]